MPLGVEQVVRKQKQAKDECNGRPCNFRDRRVAEKQGQIADDQGRHQHLGFDRPRAKHIDQEAEQAWHVPLMRMEKGMRRFGQTIGFIGQPERFPERERIEVMRVPPDRESLVTIHDVGNEGRPDEEPAIIELVKTDQHPEQRPEVLGTAIDQERYRTKHFDARIA